MESFVKRPRVLDDVIGQSKVVCDMKSFSYLYRVDGGNFPKSMVFTGPTGTGKTSTALIVAAVINCQSPIERDGYFDPCLECPSCKDIMGERFSRDVHMYDASTMGKDDVVNLENQARMFPMYDKRKIIVIDEAQELSAKSFGATLKLLEKERNHLHFILCTMDEKSINKAIRDRCKTYRFFPMTAEKLSEYLFKVLTERNIKVPSEFLSEGIFLVSEFSEGSIRAALSYLDRCVKGELFDADSIRKELGSYTDTTISDMIAKLLIYDVSVIDDLMLGNLEEIANKMYYILVQAKMYSLNNEVRLVDWKARSYAKMIKNDSFEDLLSATAKAFQLPYFRPTVFLHHITEYLTKAINPPIVHKTSTAPKRVSGRRLVER